MSSPTAMSALPRYIQISEMLIREIAAGHLADGARLPPEREMAAALDISVGTLRKALADLVAKGLLHRVQGSGNYVRQKAGVESVYAFFRLELLGGGGLPTAQVISVDRTAKPEGAPDFGPDMQGHRIRRLRYLGDTLIALEEIWLDGSFRDRITPYDLSDSLYHFYRHELGLVIGVASDEVGVGQVPDWAPDTFHMRPGATTGFIARQSRDIAGRPAEFSWTWFDHNRARYISRMGKG